MMKKNTLETFMKGDMAYCLSPSSKNSFDGVDSNARKKAMKKNTSEYAV